MNILTDPFGLRTGRTYAHLNSAAPVGNQAPIAVSDTVTVQRMDGPVTLDVLANDVDLDGGALMLISASASMGLAVAEADGTITYTPPASTEVLDTITYIIADPEGAQASTTVTVTIEDPQLLITQSGDSQLVVNAQDGLVDITITTPVMFAGTYQVDIADLAAGPVSVVAPIITGTAEEGEVLTVHALWLYDYENGAPAIAYQWLRDGATIAGATAQTYSVEGPDAGATLAVHVTATDTSGARMATSAGVAVPGVSYPGALYLAQNADTGTGPVATLAAAFDTGTALQQTTESHRPNAGSGLITFDGGDILQPVAQGYDAFAAKTLLPDGAGGSDTGEGFTITGLTRLANGTWAAGNAGLPVPDSDNAQVGSVVLLSADFSTLQAEFPVSDYDASAESAVQGVAQDGAGNLWAVAKHLGKLICIDPANGTEIDQISLPYTPNGLAWDSLRGELIVHDEDADVLRWINSTTEVQSQTRAVPTDTDHLHFDSDFMTEGAVWFTTGASGNSGQVQIMDVATGDYEDHEDSFDSTAAIEGVFYDRASQRLYVADDAYFHNGTADGNAVYAYDLAPPLERQFSLFFSGSVPSGGDTDCILAYGRHASTVGVTGLYRPSGGNSLRVVLQRGGVSGPINFTAADLSVTADYWVDVDLDANTATLFIDGTEAETVAITTAYPTWLAAGDGGLTLGGCLQLPSNTVARTITMEVRAAGVAFKAGQRAATETLYI